MRIRDLCILVLVTVAGPSLARADGPSDPCRDGAVQCRDAWARLDQCEREHGAAAEACRKVRDDADTACKATTSACHTDGSRSTPPRKP